MAKQATKLKDMHLTSVDLVRAGANQEADICLFKSADPQEATETPTERETNIFKRFINWLRENPAEAESEPEETVEKEYSTFNTVNAEQESRQKLWDYQDALRASIRSIVDDRELTTEQRLQLFNQSLNEFNEAMTDIFKVLCKAVPLEDGEFMKSAEEDLSYLTEDLEKSDFEEGPVEEPEELEKSDRYDEIEYF